MIFGDIRVTITEVLKLVCNKGCEKECLYQN